MSEGVRQQIDFPVSDSRAATLLSGVVALLRCLYPDDMKKGVRVLGMVLKAQEEDVDGE